MRQCRQFERALERYNRKYLGPRSSLLRQHFGQLRQRSFQSVLTHRANAAHAHHPARFGGKLLKHSLRDWLGEAPATLLARGYAALIAVTTERTAPWIHDGFFHAGCLANPARKIWAARTILISAASTSGRPRRLSPQSG